MGYQVLFYNNVFKDLHPDTAGYFEIDDKSNAVLHQDSFESVPSVYHLDWGLGDLIPSSWHLEFNDEKSTASGSLNIVLTPSMPADNCHVELVLSEALALHNKELGAFQKKQQLNNIAKVIVYYAGAEGGNNLTIFARDEEGNDLISPQALKLEPTGHPPVFPAPPLEACPIAGMDSFDNGETTHYAIALPSDQNSKKKIFPNYKPNPKYIDCPPNNGKDLGSIWEIFPDNGHPLTLYPVENSGIFKGKWISHYEIRYATFPCWGGEAPDDDETKRDLKYEDGVWRKKLPDGSLNNGIKIHGNSFCFVVFVYGKNQFDPHSHEPITKPGDEDHGRSVSLFGAIRNVSKAARSFLKILLLPNKRK